MQKADNEQAGKLFRSRRAQARFTRQRSISSKATDRIPVLADMPGELKANDLKIDLRENVLTLSAPVSSPEAQGESSILREYETGTFFRQFTCRKSSIKRGSTPS